MHQKYFWRVGSGQEKIWKEYTLAPSAGF